VDVFEQARKKIGPNLIESLFPGPGAHWQAGEWWTLNPTRADKSVGSFSINGENGLWKDIATGEGGDLIKLVSIVRSCTLKEAAENIIRESGGVVETEESAQKAKKREKVKAQIPAPEEALKLMNQASTASWAVEKYGKPVKGWTYRDASGGVVFTITRHEKTDGSKDVVPWYFGIDGRWHNGQAVDHGRPLYRSDLLAKAEKTLPRLVVEGEKCADCVVPGMILTTWPGGASATTRADWSLLENVPVLIWPDADAQKDKNGKLLSWEKQPGMVAAIAIKNRLPHAQILDVREKAKVKDGWDIFDAIAEGIDPVAFIAGAMPKKEDEKNGDAGEFACLGHDATHHWFLRRGVRVPYKISIGGFTSSKLLSLARLSFWGMNGMVGEADGIKTAMAQDFVEGMSFGIGQYRPERIRGAGVWRDKDGFLINDGSKIILHNGETRALDDYQTDHHYISSSVQFPGMTGFESAADEGKILSELFKVQGWATEAQSILAMGWALIAPFGGVLKWRPHIWVTGRRGSGKTWALNDLIYPLCGPFAHKGSGKDSEAGVRRSLDMDARPVVLDEMEPKGQRASDRVSAILDLARNASSDGSGYITLASSDGGTQRFVVRSCFCFGSIQTPDEGAAIASRISRLELKAPTDQKAKFRASSALYAEAMKDPERYRRRIFKALPRILQDIEWLRSDFLDLFGEQRRADQYAPMLAAAWAVQSDESMQKMQGMEWFAALTPYLGADSDTAKDDEEAVIDHILSAHVRHDTGVRTISELLKEGFEDMKPWAQDLLGRYGIKVYSGGLAIVAKSDQIKALLKDTPYASGYGAQIRRHRLSIGDTPRQVRIAGQSRAQCYVLDWSRFRQEYLSDEIELDLEPPF